MIDLIFKSDERSGGSDIRRKAIPQMRPSVKTMFSKIDTGLDRTNLSSIFSESSKRMLDYDRDEVSAWKRASLGYGCGF